MIYHVRGDVVTFTASFLDVNGNPPALEAAATLTVTYPNNVPARMIMEINAGNEKATQIIPMTVDATGQNWTADWDSGIAAHGLVYWNIQSTGSPQTAFEGQFMLRRSHMPKPAAQSFLLLNDGSFVLLNDGISKIQLNV